MNDMAVMKKIRPGWEYLKTWAGIFQVKIFWVGLFRGREGNLPDGV